MRTDEERADLVRRRTAELRRRRRDRARRAVDALCAAGCLALVACLGAWMPGQLEGGGVEVAHASGAASLVASGSALGYILVGLASFLLGSGVTVLAFRLRRRDEERERVEGRGRPGADDPRAGGLASTGGGPTSPGASPSPSSSGGGDDEL